MKATVLAAALLVPGVVLADEAATRVLNTLHRVSQQSLEAATLARTNSRAAQVKSFAAEQQRDFDRLDRFVLGHARARRITIVQPPTTMRPEDVGKGAGTYQGKIFSNDPMSLDSPATQTGTANETRTQTNNLADPRVEEATPVDARMELLRSLEGAAFDAEYLSMAAERAQAQISMLEALRVEADLDAQVDRLVGAAIQTLRAQQHRALKLQRSLFADSSIDSIAPPVHPERSRGAPDVHS